jgi:ATP-dependent RNA circularization protein (DNA/RNA ligase family)
MTDLFRFPHTPHLAWLGAGEPRDDKVLSPEDVRSLLGNEVAVEEKLDGANVGLSAPEAGKLRVQNRGHYLEAPYTSQFARLGSWIAAHDARLLEALGSQLIAFGEWCAARHSIAYTALPDWWVLFDIYDRAERRFWSTARRDAWANAVGVHAAPLIFSGRTGLSDLKTLLLNQPSHYRDGPTEGLVVRAEDERWLLSRAKLVRADFTQNIDAHWRKKRLEWNRLQDST